MIGALDGQRNIRRDPVAGFVQALCLRKHQPGHDQGLGAATAVGEPALDENLIKALFTGLGHDASIPRQT